MPPKTETYRRIRQRMRRSLGYGSRRMDSLTLPLSEMVVDYFDRRAPYDYLDMDFAAQLSRDGCLDACTMLVAMVYIDRVRGMDRSFFDESDASELFLSALVVASKYLQDGGLDEFVYNDEWGAAASTSTKRVNELEVQLLNALTWNANVSDVEFEQSLESCERWVARRALLRNGFCTYNEAHVLSARTAFSEWRSLLESVAFACAAIAAVYVASVISLYTAIHIARTKHLTPSDSHRHTTVPLHRTTVSHEPLLLRLEENSTALRNRGFSAEDGLEALARSLVPSTEPGYCYPLCDLDIRENVTSLRDQRVVLQQHLRVPIALRSN
uniref:Protein CNPPD1 n=1 Tax=Steinernema glaseri TaxID=37863 RepID=A0A1I8AVT8_9BILA